MTVIVNHVAQAQNLLASQFRDKPIFAALVGAIVEECQEIEYAFQQLKYLVLLPLANGLQLDRIGDALQRARMANENDEDYKVALGIAVLTNTANGSPDAALKLIAALANPTVLTYSLTDGSKPTFVHNGTFIPGLVTRLRDIAPVGCGTILLTQPGDPIPEEG